MEFLKRWLNALWDLITSFRSPTLKVAIITGDIFPKPLPKGRIVLLDDDGQYAVGMRCPCGCGESIELMVMEGVYPRWDIELDDKSRPTLRPSVWKQSGCQSHFWITNGRVIWCT